MERVQHVTQVPSEKRAPKKLVNTTVDFPDDIFEIIETLCFDHCLSMNYVIHAAMKAAGASLNEDDFEKNPSRRRPLGRKVQGSMRRVQFKISRENQQLVRKF